MGFKTELNEGEVYFDMERMELTSPQGNKFDMKGAEKVFVLVDENEIAVYWEIAKYEGSVVVCTETIGDKSGKAIVAVIEEHNILRPESSDLN